MHPNFSGHITGAELLTLRTACGMTRDDLAELVGVQPRSIKFWEVGRAGVPADVMQTVFNINDLIDMAVHGALAAMQTACIATGGSPPEDVVLLRYETEQDLRRYRPDMAHMPPNVQGAIACRLRVVMACTPELANTVVRIVWMRPDQYEPWRAACHLPDNEATRSQWAGQQIAVQAIQHKGDQPPPDTSPAPL